MVMCVGFVLVSVALFVLLTPVPAHEGEFYYRASSKDLGSVNFEVATGNPLKGLVGNPDSTNIRETNGIESSMEFWSIGLNKVMIDNPDNVGSNAFDWTEVEKRLESSERRGRHSIMSFHVHWPGQPLRLPRHIKQSELELHWYKDLGGGASPDYGDEVLLRALEQFVEEFGRLYNKDIRIGFVHLGLLGFW